MYKKLLQSMQTLQNVQCPRLTVKEMGEAFTPPLILSTNQAFLYFP